MIIFNRRFAPSWVMTMITISGLILFTSLGLWQLQRAAIKEAIEMKFETRLGADYRRFEAWESMPDIEFQKLMISGRYDTHRTLLIDNQLHQGKAGYHVLSPFILDGGKNIVLGNRGWVALGSSRQQLPTIQMPAADGMIRGIVSIPDMDSFRMGDVSLEDKWPQVIPFIDIDAMQAEFQNRLLPITLWLGPEQAGHYPRVWNPVWLDPKKSRAYAWQWFAFAAISLVLFIGLNLRSVSNERK